MFAKRRIEKTVNAIGQICAEAAVSCPPAIPIAVSGELISKEIADALISCGIQEIEVVDNK